MGMTVIFFQKKIFLSIYLDIFKFFFLGSNVCLAQKLENQSRHYPSSPKKS